MRKAHGYSQAFRDGILTEEMDSFSCAHCNFEVFVRPGRDVTIDADAILHRRPEMKHAGLGGICLQCADGFSRGLLCPACEKEQAAGGFGRPGEVVISNIGAKNKCRNFERRLQAYEQRSRMLEAIGV